MGYQRLSSPDILPPKRPVPPHTIEYYWRLLHLRT